MRWLGERAIKTFRIEDADGERSSLNMSAASAAMLSIFGRGGIDDLDRLLTLIKEYKQFSIMRVGRVSSASMTGGRRCHRHPRTLRQQFSDRRLAREEPLLHRRAGAAGADWPLITTAVKQVPTSEHHRVLRRTPPRADIMYAGGTREGCANLSMSFVDRQGREGWEVIAVSFRQP